MTGHAGGVITLNIEEADDARREQIRKEMGEPYHTLVGHFRHEVGHYYWDRLVARSEAIGEFRRLFGDETEDYSAALHSTTHKDRRQGGVSTTSPPTVPTLGKIGRKPGLTTCWTL
jgi:hypothetical protein